MKSLRKLTSFVLLAAGGIGLAWAGFDLKSNANSAAGSPSARSAMPVPGGCGAADSPPADDAWFVRRLAVQAAGGVAMGAAAFHEVPVDSEKALGTWPASALINRDGTPCTSSRAGDHVFTLAQDALRATVTSADIVASSSVPNTYDVRVIVNGTGTAYSAVRQTALDSADPPHPTYGTQDPWGLAVVYDNAIYRFVRYGDLVAEMASQGYLVVASGVSLQIANNIAGTIVPQ